jgi:eukaryotic-like serine/threonine-protein kinase
VGSILCLRYQVRRVIADGGMGRVYEALDMQHKARVALKVLHPEVARDTVAVERFKREFEVSALLPHDHIVEVMDFRETEDKSYVLVMEFLDGEELRNVLKREKRLRPERLVRMLSQVAIGLDEAHRRQLIHRDLKPDNIFLCGTREGDIVKILDFGSVKDKSETAKQLTVVGTTIGSPFYMPPEQAQGLSTINARADVWALAAIAYEALTGVVPFHGVNGPSILLAILTKDPVPPTVAGKGGGVPIPRGLDEVMEVALAKNPNIRTSSVGALADEIGRAFGLSGSHLEWAYLPQAVLADAIGRELPRLMQVPPAPELGMLSDPFASRAAGADAVRAEPQPPPPSRMQAGRMPSGAPFAPDDDVIMGVPKALPRWLVPTIVVVLAALLGLVAVVLHLR